VPGSCRRSGPSHPTDQRHEAQATSAAADGLAVNNGVLVENVSPGGPAAQAVIQPGDVIVPIGDVPVQSQKDLQLALTLRYKLGETVPVKVNRGGQEQTLQVTLGTRP
jgi:S1-C subfamily serine protease